MLESSIAGGKDPELDSKCRSDIDGGGQDRVRGVKAECLAHLAGGERHAVFERAIVSSLNISRVVLTRPPGDHISRRAETIFVNNRADTLPAYDGCICPVAEVDEESFIDFKCRVAIHGNRDGRGCAA